MPEVAFLYYCFPVALGGLTLFSQKSDLLWLMVPPPRPLGSFRPSLPVDQGLGIGLPGRGWAGSCVWVDGQMAGVLP